MPLSFFALTSRGIVSCVFVLSVSSGRTWELPVSGNGVLKLPLPQTWKELGRTTPADLPPTLHMGRSANPRGEVEVTVLWNPKASSQVLTADQIRELTLKGQASVLASAAEKDLPLVPIKGTSGSGFYYSATDKTYTRPATGPVAGEFPIITHGELGLGSCIVSFTIYSDEKNDACVQEALAALKSCTIVPTGPKK